jgi:hypothetical protein
MGSIPISSTNSSNELPINLAREVSAPLPQPEPVNVGKTTEERH